MKEVCVNYEMKENKKICEYASASHKSLSLCVGELQREPCASWRFQCKAKADVSCHPRGTDNTEAADVCSQREPHAH